MRPTLNNPDWKTIQNWLHIDYNPFTGLTSSYGFSSTEINEKAKDQEQFVPWQNAYFQGIVAIDDCPVETGGLHVVPGFHTTIEQWRDANLEHCQCGAYS